MDADRYTLVTQIGQKVKQQKEQEEARLAGLAEFVGSEAFEIDFMQIMNGFIAEAQTDLDRSPNWFEKHVTKTGYIVQQECARLQKQLVARIVSELREKKATYDRIQQRKEAERILGR